jgi:hypothetical protein
VGTSRNPAEMVAKIKSLGDATERRSKLAVSEGALAAKTIMLASAAAKGLTPASRLAGRRWSVRFDIRATGTHPTALVRYTGPFHLFDNPTSPHVITAKRLGQRTSRRGRQQRAATGGAGVFGGFGERGGAKALTIGGNLRAYANHPGTSGAHTFPAAKLIAQRRVPRVMAATVSHGWALALR